MHIHTSEQEKLELGFGNYSCNWGIHICGLYETIAERDEIIMGYLHQGDISGDLQLYCPVERTNEDFTSQYSKRFPESAESTMNSRKFILYNAKELYYPSGIFSPWDMDKNLNSFFHESQKNGKRNIRATAEMVWALEAIPGVEHLMAYEARLNLFIPGKPWISICLYNLNKFKGSDIIRVLQTHPYSINGGVITQNPFYQNPIDWLKKNASQFLD
jgi:hypothetical protein